MPPTCPTVRHEGAKKDIRTHRQNLQGLMRALNIWEPEKRICFRSRNINIIIGKENILFRQTANGFRIDNWKANF